MSNCFRSSSSSSSEIFFDSLVCKVVIEEMLRIENFFCAHLFAAAFHFFVPSVKFLGRFRSLQLYGERLKKRYYEDKNDFFFFLNLFAREVQVVLFEKQDR